MSTVYVPEVATKKLKVQKAASGRKLVISSNMLRMFGFEPRVQTIERPLGNGKGFEVVLYSSDLFGTDIRPKKVYERKYGKRKNNPFEAMLDIRRKDLLECIPDHIDRVHIRFEFGKITVTPVKEGRYTKYAKNLRAFLGCSSGVDGLQLHRAGFSIEGQVEWRPNEKRDNRDLTETGMMTSIANYPVKNFYNEDITHINLSDLASDLIDNPVSFACFSPVCSDFSNVKANSIKERHKAEGTSTLSMIYDVMRLIEGLNPATVLVEQVPGFKTHAAFDILSERMKKWGYTEHSDIYNAVEFGGFTSRKRCYAFFTRLSAPFSMPKQTPVTADQLWTVVERHLPDCRDVSHSKSIQDGKACGRLRVLKKGDSKAPTILRTQLRQAKDSLVIEHDGKFLFPSEGLLAELQGIPDGMKFDTVSKEQAVEVIGQSVDGRMHDVLIDSIVSHIRQGLLQ